MSEENRYSDQEKDGMDRNFVTETDGDHLRKWSVKAIFRRREKMLRAERVY